MRIYMLPLTITATLMSANAVQAERAHHYKAQASTHSQSHTRVARATVSKSLGNGAEDAS